MWLCVLSTCCRHPSALQNSWHWQCRRRGCPKRMLTTGSGWSTPGVWLSRCWTGVAVCLWVGLTVSGDQMVDSRGLSVGWVDCVCWSDEQLQRSVCGLGDCVRWSDDQLQGSVCGLGGLCQVIRRSTPGVCLWVGWTVSGDQMIDSRGLTDGLGGLCQVIRWSTPGVWLMGWVDCVRWSDDQLQGSVCGCGGTVSDD